MMGKRIVIIDGNSLINRAFYALPPLTTREGQHTNAIYGFMTMLLRLLEDYNPQYIGVAFDKRAPTFRHKQYEEYKAGRKGMPQELAEQMDPLKEILDVFKIFRIELEGFEADDLIGTLAKYCENRGLESLIVTGDKDALQLASDKTKVLYTRRGISNIELYDDKKVIEELQVTPSQFIDLKGLMGDRSDNIPGIPGVGEKTALKLIKQFGSVENLVQNTDKIKGKKLKERIEENLEQAILSKKLATIVTNVPIDLDLEKLRYERVDTDKIVETFQKYEFSSLINRIVAQSNGEAEELDNKLPIIRIKDLDSLKPLVDGLKKSNNMYFKSIVSADNILENQLVAMGITSGDAKQYYIDFTQLEDRDGVLGAIKDILEDKRINKISHDLKEELLHFYPHKIDIKNLAFDTMIGEYLLDPSKRNYSIKELAAQYFGQNLKDQVELRGKGRGQIKFIDVESGELENYLCQQVQTIVKLKEAMETKLEEMELTELYYKIELPLTEVLASMEYQGIEVDRHMLQELEIEFNEMIENLTKSIYQLAGAEFNVNSPKQLSEILFEKLQLTPIRRTKTGYSTGVDVLEKLYDKHEIIPKILEYRHVAKIKTTYIDGLLNIINPITGRIHSSFNQTVTTTGRISSTEPNLQNIPIKTELGRQLRKVFRAKENHKFIDADYSQIELRVLAHISEDENLLESFQKNQDVHRRTASEIFNVPIDMVTPAMRDDAKAVNFGIIYGISDFGLSENLNISIYKAKKYIENYLNKYASVKKYMDEAIRMAKERGYVITLLNRRRYLPEITSRNYNTRSFGERMAMNTPIQGSAADIIKIAMVRVYQQLKDGGYEAQLILQVHDELIVECPNHEIDQVKSILKESMEEAIQLKVPLKVDLSLGDTWYDA